MLLSEPFVNCVQLLRLALHHHCIGLLILNDIIGSKLNGQIENMLLLVILRKLCMMESGDGYCNGADVVKETRGTASRSEVTHALGEEMADFRNGSFFVVSQTFNNNSAASRTEAFICSRLKLVRTYVIPLPLLLLRFFPFRARSMLSFGMLAARAAVSAAFSLMLLSRRDTFTLFLTRIITTCLDSSRNTLG